MPALFFAERVHKAGIWRCSTLKRGTRQPPRDVCGSPLSAARPLLSQAYNDS